MGRRLPGILHLHGNSHVIAGQECALRQIVNALRDDARQYVLLPREGPFRDWLQSEGIETVLLPLEPLTRRNPLPYVDSLRQLMRVMHDLRIDLVHASGAYPNQHGSPAARFTRRKAVCVLHNPDYLPRELRRTFVPFAHLVIAVSNGTRECARGLVADRKLVTRYLGVDLTRFDGLPSGAEVRRELGIPEHAVVLGQFGQLIERKRTLDTIRAVAALQRRYPDLFLLIAGEDHHGTGYREEVERLVRSVGLEGRSLLVGFCGNIARLYAALDLFVFPSRSEGLGLVLLEAMAASRPVVASRIPGVIEVVVEGVTGRLVPPLDVESLTEAIAWLLDHPAERQQMGRAGRARVEERFDAAVCMEAYRKSFLDLIGSG